MELDFSLILVAKKKSTLSYYKPRIRWAMACPTTYSVDLTTGQISVEMSAVRCLVKCPMVWF
jgi:hypothetical protein